MNLAEDTVMLTAPRVPRDWQKSRVYDADDVLRAHDGGLVDQLGAYRFVNGLLQRKRVRPLSHGQPSLAIEVNPRMHDREAYLNVEGRVIVCAPDGHRPAVFLHETAHHLVIRNHGYCVPFHGEEFAGMLLWLTVITLGRDAATVLYRAYERHRVRWADLDYLPPTARCASPYARRLAA